MKIAIASSGLGHVARGIETWARDTAAALAECGIDVTLFAAERIEYESGGRKDETGDLKPEMGSKKEDKTENQNPDTRHPTLDPRDLHPVSRISHLASRSPYPSPRVIVVACLKRNEPRTLRLAKVMPGCTWRWGLKDGYGWEQTSFWWHLWPWLRREEFDILHVQDPLLAWWCRKFRRLGLLRTREILAHGTEEPVAFLDQFDYVQHLAPWHLEHSHPVPLP